MLWLEFDQYDYCVEYETFDVFSIVFAIDFIKRYNKLPARFNAWSTGASIGWTVAHEAALVGVLPKSFKYWELTDSNGRTVAHIAALYGNLPKHLNDQDILHTKDGFGYAVLDYKNMYDKYLVYIRTLGEHFNKK